jgi:hypothetical protein
MINPHLIKCGIQHTVCNNAVSVEQARRDNLYEQQVKEGTIVDDNTEMLLYKFIGHFEDYSARH